MYPCRECTTEQARTWGAYAIYGGAAFPLRALSPDEVPPRAERKGTAPVGTLESASVPQEARSEGLASGALETPTRDGPRVHFAEGYPEEFEVAAAKVNLRVSASFVAPEASG